ncbi:MAG: phage tail tape measure protein [Pseudacidovorax sp.]|uniref:phage tail tape measure protein n=1 Tax=Pseudacidovorax sp. TaxID=1934311 RepID=UPI001B77F3DD|nr:phage tail tape measure protein [Pseudacidovorax sp.]MBP6897377.1 phage tail tape measure protein [Pseudacidovorax sp.]
MRELRLRYLIDLASNIGQRSRAEAQALEAAQKVMQGAIAGTNNKLTDWTKLNASATKETDLLQAAVTGVSNRFTQARVAADQLRTATDRLGTTERETVRDTEALDRALTRLGSNTSTERQARYMRQLADSTQAAQTRMERLGNAWNAAQRVGTVAAGAAAGGYIVASALKAPMDYDTRLRAVASTAFAGGTIGELRGGMTDINDLVNGTVRNVKGARRESALEAFEKLVGTGSFSYDESKALLPKIMRTAVAGRASADDLVQAAEKWKVSLGLTPDEIELALAKLTRAGQEGGFEIKDSAKWVGPLMPYMKGYHGMEAVEQLVTMLQQVRSTAGTNDEAANNLRNFVQKMGADSTRKEFAKQGFDLDAEMAQGVLKRQTPVATYMALLEKVMAKGDPEGKARKLMEQADKAATPEQRTQQYEDIKRIYEGSQVSKIINDLQEFGGYEGLRRTGDYGRRVLAAVQSERGGAVDIGYQFMAEGIGAKAIALQNSRDIAGSDALEKLSGPLGNVIDGTNALAEKFPSLASSAWGATVALGALQAMSILQTALLAKAIKGAPGAAGEGAAAGAGAGAGASAARSAALGQVARNALKYGGTVAAIGGGIEALGVLADPEADKARELTRVGVTTGGGLAGAVGGAALGSIVPGVGTVLGGLIGGALGGFGGSALTGSLFDWLWSKKDPAQRAAATPVTQAEMARAFPSGLQVPSLDLLTLSAPGAALGTTLQAGKTTELKVGEGVLRLDLVVRDERVDVRPSVPQQPSLIKINPGGTDPGSFTGFGR